MMPTQPKSAEFRPTSSTREEFDRGLPCQPRVALLRTIHSGTRIGKRARVRCPRNEDARTANWLDRSAAQPP